MIDQPYFMKNENWFYYDFNKKKYKLTENAPNKAKKSYKEYYKELETQIIDEDSAFANNQT